jgi:hypothetical protein
MASTGTNTADVTLGLNNPDALAGEIMNMWYRWKSARNLIEQRWVETKRYVFATSTRETTNAKNPWDNTVNRPKLYNLYNNLLVNTDFALFPKSDWLEFISFDQQSDSKAKRDAAVAYLRTKHRMSGFRQVIRRLVSDWILYGNCFGMVEWQEGFTTKESGEFIPSYVGPKLKRISPYDICFNPTAASFEDSPKIIKSIKSLGEIKRMIDSDPNNDYLNGVFEKMMSARKNVRGTDGHFEKAEGFIADGFTSIEQYYESDYVEIMTFYGDIYDQESGELMSDRVITIVDRAHVLDNQENPSWMGKAPIFHSGWRNRPDNLYAMGPLDNLVGMQYRIDHLENLKADVFDQIAYPILKIKGDVEDFDFEPGARIYMGEEGDVGYMAPDSTAHPLGQQSKSIRKKTDEIGS